ncbi:MAG: hypothetical protein QOJ72_636 [Nocardioidaceae bacterium]|nr:hypothetical protein [Nocardioidaceae bacterium]
MVTAVVVVLVATATVSSIGGSQLAASRNQSRAATAQLAEQDQERMRAIRTSDLANFTDSHSQTLGGITYKVDSSTKFVTDTGAATISCTSTGSATQYLQLTTTVTPPPGRRMTPLTVNSIEALPVSQFSPTSGALSQLVLKADGVTPQAAGIPVTLAGPQNRSGFTNAAGCAVFTFVTPGSYKVTVGPYQPVAGAPGFVDKGGNESSVTTTSINVTPATITTAPTDIYDQGRYINILTDTLRNDGKGSDTFQWTDGVSVSNSGIPTSGVQITNATPDTVFPFTTPVYTYAGTCKASDPLKWGPANYYTLHSGYGPTTPSPATGPFTVTVRLPPILSQFIFNNGPSSKVAKVYQTDSECAPTAPPAPAPEPIYTTTVNSDGTLARATYPLGTYKICVQAVFSGTTRSLTVNNVANTTWGGVGTSAAPAGGTQTLSNTSPAGSCPAY